MTKIAYNACYGGFGLSHKAVLRYAEIRGLNITFEHDKDYKCLDITYYKIDGEDFSEKEISRDDHALIQVIEELGAEASDRFSNLQIAELDVGTKYRIDEYDGYENVMKQDDYDWSVA